MGVNLLLFLTVIAASSAQNAYRVCIPNSQPVLCQSLDKDGSQVKCEAVESKIDCALKLSRGEADLGVFSEEEMVLLPQHPTGNNYRIVGSIRDVSKTEPFAFEAVAVVASSHTGGLEGLRGGRYCHPGLDEPDLRWSSRVLKTLEKLAAKTDRCPDANTNGKTAEEMEVETLSQFFNSACRPGPWSANTTVDANLKSRFQSLCSLCGDNSDCSRYTIDMGVTVSGVRNDNRHIQALECLRSGNESRVAYVAWQHVREFFNIRNPQEATSYSLLCPDETLVVLTSEVLAQGTAPCSFVKQPWSALVAPTNQAKGIQTNLQQWWQNGASPGGNSWQAVLFGAIVGGSSARVLFDETLPNLSYSANLRNISAIDASPSCIPARRWCTISESEHSKCLWVQLAAHTLGIEPAISCQQRKSIFECFAAIKDNTADFIAAPANYGFLARQHYGLSSVKLVQNSRNDPRAFSRVATLLQASSSITRFENLRGKKACFPEFGGISYVAFIRAAQERDVISRSECDYARAVGEFFGGACAPGALNASHVIASSDYDVKPLCSLCKPANTSVAPEGTEICSYDSNNKYYGNAGAVACLADPDSDVAFVELENIDANLRAAGLDASQIRVLCRNNTLALSTGVSVDSNCLLADVVDSEVLARRNDPLLNSLNALLDTLDLHFGYNAATSTQLINLAIYSPLDGVNDLLFKNTAVGLSEPSSAAANEASRNYNELFKHLDSCTSAAPGNGAKNYYSYVTFVLMAIMTKYVVY
ncbi:transferrin-like [Pieris brassicae]|uniref:transferrin-like n=1 Tax=Pieris brassicae TaxID=7116 RepID=UPI001E661235|nr:transferrin-like [Pieris brassicae]